MIFRILDNKIVDFRSDYFGYTYEEMDGYIFTSNIDLDALNLLSIKEFTEDNINKYFKYDVQYIKISKISDDEYVDIILKEKINLLSNINNRYIESRYQLPRQISFTLLKIEAVLPKIINNQDITGTKYETALNQLNEIQTWIFNYPMSYYYQKEFELITLSKNIKNGLNSIEELENINESNWDFEQFSQYDPEHEIGFIYNILNS